MDFERVVRLGTTRLFYGCFPVAGCGRYIMASTRAIEKKMLSMVSHWVPKAPRLPSVKMVMMREMA